MMHVENALIVFTEMVQPKQTGMEAIERLRFLASFGPPSTGKRKRGEKTQPFNRFHSTPGTLLGVQSFARF